MGITNLKSLIKALAKQRSLAAYRGKRVAVDASIWLYKLIYSDEENAVIDGILQQLRQFHRFQITPIYVFDGKASSQVKIEIERRQERREKVRNTLESLEIELSETLESLGDTQSAALVLIDAETQPVGNAKVELPFDALDVPMFIEDSEDEEFKRNESLPEPALEWTEVDTTEILMLRAVSIQERIRSLQKQARRPTKEIVGECKALFDLLGVPYVQSPGESDVTLAEMSLRGDVDAVFSEDTDMLPYGCEVFVTGFRSDRDMVTEFRLSEVLQHLQLTREQFVDVCILCGCDYAEKIYKVGVKTGYNMIKRHQTIENVLHYIDSMPKLALRHTYPDDFRQQIVIARNMFLTRCPDGGAPELGNPHEYGWNFTLATAQKGEYRAFLKERCLRNPNLLNLCNHWGALHSESSGTQRNLFEFFGTKNTK